MNPSETVTHTENQITNATPVPPPAETTPKSVQADAAAQNMVVGGLWCVGGIAVTALTYQAASAQGGHYIIAWGAILFGGLQFLKGLMQSVD